MARTRLKIPLTKKREEVISIFEKVLADAGYKMVAYGNESCFKAGTGMMTAMKFIKPEFAENELILSGWVCMGIGSATLNELELKGFVGMLPKKSVLKVMKTIEQDIQ